MFRLVIVSFFLLLSSNCFCRTPIDSLNNRISQLEKSYKQSNDLLKRRNDSLQRELLTYKVKDGFYSDAYSSQGTLYSALMGIISTIIVAIGIGFIITKVNVLQKTLQDQIDDLTEDTAQLHGSAKINFATSLLGLGRHADIEATKAYNEDRYASAIVSGFQAMFHYCSAFSLHTDAISQEQINEMINEIIGCCGVSATMLKAIIERDDREVEQIFNFRKDLRSIIENITLDDLVSTSVTGEVRSKYYHVKDDIAQVLKGIEISKG